jgi:G3E family GTPase
MSAARCILIGGFPGAGKTTALAAVAGELAKGGRRVAVVTNDHGVELVDTAILRAQGLNTREVSGGSFGSHLERLSDALKALEKSTAPDCVLAEVVGTSTDLAATIVHPLQQLHGQALVMAPITTLVDPLLAERMLGLAPGDSFSEKVLYVCRKQIEEADLIVISKADRLDDARIERLRGALAAEFSRAQVIILSARDGRGVKEWAALLESDAHDTRPALEVDYAIYAEGQAQIGWLNSTIEFYGAGTADPQAMLTTLARRIQTGLPEGEIAHFKIALRPDGTDDVAVINLTRRGAEPELSRRVEEPVDNGELIINLRAETAPETLHTALRQAVVELVKEFPGLKIEFAHLHYFRPAKPVTR